MMATTDELPASELSRPAWSAELAGLAAQVAGPILVPGDEGYPAESTGFDLSVPQRPALIVGASTTDDVVAAVRFALSHGLFVGVQATGHGPTVAADGCLLINTGRMTAVDVVAVNRTARLQAGTQWTDVIEAAAPFGLAPLSGSAPSVGAVSYSLGGGIGVLSRRFGFGADHIRAIEVVTADGELRRVTAEDSPDLFWAMRGAGANFGVVTSIEADLVAVPELYAGGLFFPGGDRADVLAAFVESVSTAPDALSLSVAVYTFPDLPTLPAAVRGRHCCHIRVTHQGAAAEAESFLDAIRGAGSVLLDTVRPLPLTEIGTIHNDRTAPLNVHSRSLVLRGLDQGLVDTVIAHTAPDATSLVELRHLGGALGRPPVVGNAVGHRGGVANLFTTAYPTDDHTVADTEQARLLADLEPWSDGGALSTFLLGSKVTPADVRAAFRPEDYDRLVQLKTKWDPGNIFRFNQNIQASDEPA
jgi:hypothetical protein